MVNILICHCQSEGISYAFSLGETISDAFVINLDDFIKVKALMWIQEFIRLAGNTVLRYSSGILAAILPTLSYEDLMHKDILYLNFILSCSLI